MTDDELVAALDIRIRHYVNVDPLEVHPAQAENSDQTLAALIQARAVVRPYENRRDGYEEGELTLRERFQLQADGMWNPSRHRTAPPGRWGLKRSEELC